MQQNKLSYSRSSLLEPSHSAALFMKFIYFVFNLIPLRAFSITAWIRIYFDDILAV